MHRVSVKGEILFLDARYIPPEEALTLATELCWALVNIGYVVPDEIRDMAEQVADEANERLRRNQAA